MKVVHNRLSSQKKEISVVLIIATLFTLLNSLHVLYQWLMNPTDRYFTGIAHFFADYFLYVSWIAESQKGAFLLSHPFTNELLPPTWYHWPYIIIGKIAAILSLSPFAAYNGSIVIGTFSLIVLWWILARRLFPESLTKRMVCLLLIITASNFVNIIEFAKTGTAVLLGDFWYSPTSAFNRLGAIPHHILSTILYTIILATNIFHARRIIHIFCLLILFSLTALLSPVQMILLLPALAIAWGFSRSKKSMKQIVIFFVLTAVAIASMLFTKYEVNRIVVYANSNLWEQAQQISVTPFSFLLAIGPVLLFALAGAPAFIRTRSFLHLTIFFFGLFSLASFFSPLPNFLGVARVRMLHPASYVALGIVGTQGVMVFARVLSRILTRVVNVGAASLEPLCLSFVIFMYLFFTIPSLFVQIQKRVSPLTSPLLLLDTDYNHVPKMTIDALSFLKNETVTATTSVVLVDNHQPIEILVPVFTGKISFTGHPIHTLYKEYKENLRNQFFSGQMSSQDAKIFLQNHRIGYIVASNSDANRGLLKRYPFLTLRYANPATLIIKVTNF